MPRLRVCLVFPHVLLGGGETAMIEVAEGLREEHEIDPCVLDQPRPATGQTILDELARRLGAPTCVGRRWELRPRFRQADVVLWYGVVNAVGQTLSAMKDRPASVRVVHTGRHLDGAGFHRRWSRAIDATVCVCPATARRIPGAAFVPNPCARVAPGGSAGDFFPSSPGRRTLGFLGRLVPPKNVAWLVENVDRLGCNLLLQALDTPWLTVADLTRLVERRGLGARVLFLPPSREVGTLLRSVDALVLVSSHEGFPMVVIEAGMAGTPVISTRVGALPELFPGEVLFVETGAGGQPDLDSLRAAIARVDPRWGERLRARVEGLCDRRAVIEGYRGILHHAWSARSTESSASGPR
jgi:glycosyltransferase involved in cell wall biosynthesis